MAKKKLTPEEKLLEVIFGHPTKSAKPISAEQQSQLKAKLKAKIEKVLKTLTYREHEIIKLRYGLSDGYGYTTEEVGKIFKVTRERIRQIEAKALRKLHQPPHPQEQEPTGLLED